MIINHKYKFIFLKTKKTAGTSLEIALSKFCGSQDVITTIGNEDEMVREELGHTGPQNYIINNHLKKIGDFFKSHNKLYPLYMSIKPFCMYYEHIPAFFVKKHLGQKLWNEYFKFSFERNPYDKAISSYYWNTKDLENPPHISDYIENLKDRPFNRPLSSWYIYSINNEIAVDFVGKYENMEDDLRYIKQKLGLPEDIKLPKTKNKYRKDRRHYTELLDDKDLSRIENLCSREIRAFSYKHET
ncbi:sulfotransferase family 2 domain-containing protein [Methanohalophilus portucalensis]|uniref:Chondroitin 4-O-sulfotransferase n=2 Tax=Methanohalophilus portucalensis TaxID=39664 RepID=A0A1L9C4Z7_9EURY|nr:sulfotransferase family 2 domain-containing protein [Methanohalophilus portucalensis]ATU08260.1 hypothetical protein BKM01_05450 [Methanohalophilus portucalensis]OJH49577.1 hypothetical protein MPF_0365 [Methanohalophilus portucalensis FDF-1]RNI13571.1 chondroitin 4-O-sulfotransferase [Methanohalophilus portucalensis FDF-1]SMH35345.1 Sulfotransferase family protein [Methanohalophilus portucalensis FDF-1]